MPARILAPDPTAFAEAAQVLRGGGCVAFPTETVYGLGANALDADAVAGIFQAKGRPSENPVIVHVADVAAARALAAAWSPEAERLAAAHWPGPLTLVVERAATVPDVVTAGGATVGLRVPDHPVAQALLAEAGCPIAAPSANRSEEVSPTRPAHVVRSLGGFVSDLIVLDGGPCIVGIESTVVDVTGARPVVLRPGMLTIDEAGQALDAATRAGEPVRSPGQRTRHYAPSKPVEVVARADLERVRRAGDAWLSLGDDPAGAAAELYAALHRLSDDASVERILVERPPDGEAWSGIRDRLRRASSR